MRLFFEYWNQYIPYRALQTHDIIDDENNLTQIRASLTHEFESITNNFSNIGFTHHYEIIKKSNSLEESLYYINRCATEFWSVEKLKYYLKDDLYSKDKSALTNNFAITIQNDNLRNKALNTFKNEYLKQIRNLF